MLSDEIHISNIGDVCFSSDSDDLLVQIILPLTLRISLLIFGCVTRNYTNQTCTDPSLLTTKAKLQFTWDCVVVFIKLSAVWLRRWTENLSYCGLNGKFPNPEQHNYGQSQDSYAWPNHGCLFRRQTMRLSRAGTKFKVSYHVPCLRSDSYHCSCKYYVDSTSWES